MTTATTTRVPFGVLYEHPDWFRPLFAELERRGIPVKRLHAAEHWYDPSSRPPYGLVFNRMSPSAYLRNAGHAVFLTQAYLAHLESHGIRVINGSRAFAVETSKALQLSILRQLGLPYPRSRVISRASDAPSAARGLRFPVVVKPNIGGSGAGVRRFESADDLTESSIEGLNLGIDHTALVQEHVPAEDGRIVRVEVLGGSFLYGIRVYPTGESFNLCPADVCRTVDGAELVRSACAVDAPKNGLKVEGYTPPADLVRAVETIAGAAGIDVGGIEYLIDSRDGKPYFYDINALSNFVAEGSRVVGFDPFVRLVDWLEQEAA
ncbi:MAG: ATP-grasp domain-containing protein [Gemmatimonadales bacterium]